MFGLRGHRFEGDTEHVLRLDVGAEWHPDAPQAVLMASDHTSTVLALEPHPEDSDRRFVVFRWSYPLLSLSSPPNDEAIRGHRLYAKGLDKVLWAGDVINSALIYGLRVQNGVHPLHDPDRYEDLVHHVVLTKECVFEVVAESLTLARVDAESTLDAATRSIAAEEPQGRV